MHPKARLPWHTMRMVSATSPRQPNTVSNATLILFREKGNHRADRVATRVYLPMKILHAIPN